MSAPKMMRLTIYRTDAGPMSGVYDWRGALTQIRFAQTLPNFADFTIEGV